MCDHLPLHRQVSVRHLLGRFHTAVEVGVSVGREKVPRARADEEPQFPLTRKPARGVE
jgi:hypothetical protein